MALCCHGGPRHPPVLGPTPTLQGHPHRQHYSILRWLFVYVLGLAWPSLSRIRLVGLPLVLPCWQGVEVVPFNNPCMSWLHCHPSPHTALRMRHRHGCLRGELPLLEALKDQALRQRQTMQTISTLLCCRLLSDCLTPHPPSMYASVLTCPPFAFCCHFQVFSFGQAPCDNPGNMTLAPSRTLELKINKGPCPINFSLSPYWCAEAISFSVSALGRNKRRCIRMQ